MLQERSKVEDFLNSVARNSEKTRKLYGYGLTHFQSFLSSDDSGRYSQFTVGSILPVLSNNQINVYSLIDDFVSYLVSKHKNKLSPNAIALYVAALRSYLLYHDIDIVPAKFKRRVKLPKNHRENEQALDASDIRKILLSCNNRRLKAYILVLASGAMRALEAIAIRNSDIDFSSPTKIHIRSQFTKTKVSRDIYISDEATKFLKEWLDFKYRNKGSGRINLERTPEQLIFGKQSRSKGVSFLYHKLRIEFNKILQTLNMDERKEGMLRRKITFHSLRRHAKTVISDQTSSDYSEWYLGHAGSPYYTKKEADRRELYATRCMKYLTFLDYTTLENTGKNIELKLEEKEKEINYLRERDLKRETEMQAMRQDMDKVISYIRENPNLAKVKTEVLSEI
jgi:integrase